MPHSSGGGSHSGGSHSGGSNCGGSSNHHNFNGRTTRTPRTSNKYFRGSRTFVYYRRGRPYYVYSDSDIRKPSGSKIMTLLKTFLVVFSILWIWLPGFIESNLFPARLRNTEPYKIYIDDRLKILGDTSKLMDTLKKFKEKTGVTPAIVTDRNNSWDKYENLKAYAYDLYVNLFDDETHWLIVYTAPEDPDKTFVDWYWEGMQGNDTDYVINTRITNTFTSSLQKYLSDNSRHSVSEALENAFRDINKDVMKPYFSTDVWEPLIGVLIGLVVCFFILNDYYQWTKPYKSNELQEVFYVTRDHKPETDTCKHCGGIYVLDSTKNCPHCGKPIKPR